MFDLLAATLPALSAAAPGPQFSAESIYTTGATIAAVGIAAVLLNLLILMVVVSLLERVIERFSATEESKGGPHA